MKRASTVLFTSSLLLYCTGVAQAQTAQKSEPTVQAAPVPAPLPAPSGQAPAAAASPGDAASTNPLPALPPEPPGAQTAAPAPPARSAEPAASTYVPPAIEPEPELEKQKEPTTNSGFHRGFAFAVSFGYSAPAGSATGASGDDLSSTFGGQFPFALELGADVTPSLFIGVYGGYAPGGVAGTIEDSCTRSQLNCSSHSLRGGLAIRYRFAPGEAVRPWLGYGIGYEQSSVSASTSSGNASDTLDISGWELGHFSAGLDFMTGENHVAIGPFVDLGLGQYSHLHEESTQKPAQDADVTNTALHEWITVGIRATFMP